MKVIVHNLSKMKKKKEIKINNKLQNLINDIIDFDLRIKDKETPDVFKDTYDDIIDMQEVAEEFKNNIINNIINN